MSDEPDRVRRRTAQSVLRRIDDDTSARLVTYASAPRERIEERMRALDREWDTDRVLETEAAITALAGLALGLLVNRRFAAVPGLVASAVFLHATTGWYPLLPLFRRLGIRTAREIARERYALKALKGDFDDLDVENHLQEARRYVSTAGPRFEPPHGGDPSPDAGPGLH